MRIVAIDYGRKRIGLAISDPGKKIALPFKTVEGGKKEIENVLLALKDKLQEVELFLIGLPLLLSGKKGDMAKEVELFSAKLSSQTAIPFVFVDERLSSKMADWHLKETFLKKKKRKEHLDTTSAMLLLQDYLEQLRK